MYEQRLFKGILGLENVGATCIGLRLYLFGIVYRVGLSLRNFWLQDTEYLT